MKCHSCGGKNLEGQAIKVPVKVGEHTVLDGSMMRPVCMECGEYRLPASMLEKAELRAVVIAFAEVPEISGGMLRSARKALGMTQAVMAEAIGTTPESVSRWERGERDMERWVGLAVVGLVQKQLHPPPADVTLKRAS